VSVPAGPIRYLAIGDSYTIGTALPESDNFPAELARRLERATGRKVEVTNLGVNGYTSADLVREELPQVRPGGHDLVTLLIGVNDFVQGVAAERYRANLGIIHSVLAAAQLPPGGLLVLSIPDFSVTPAGPGFGRPATIEAGLRAFNAVGAEVAAAHAAPFIDIFELSRAGIDRPGWIAPDGLHPGAAQYSAWVDCAWTDVFAASVAFFS
jgi:lysophospholipase L1-like esterase